MHKDAERVSLSADARVQAHYDWVVSLDDGLNPAWLRDLLDRSRNKWDWQRGARISATGQSEKDWQKGERP